MKSLKRVSLLLACAVLWAPVKARAQYTEDERFLAKLRANRLFDLADDVCRNRLSASKLTPRERVTLTIERMLVQTEKGVNAPLAERPAAFAAAREFAKDFALNHAENARGILVRFQDALTVLTIGELQRLEAELGTSSQADIDTAKATLREAVNLLESFDTDLQKKIPDARKVSKDEGISADELTSLRSHVGYQLARAARNQALLYPEKGEDRTASLLRGKRQLEEAVLALNEAEPLHWLASIELATFERMLGETGRAAKLLEELEAKSPPPLAYAPLRAEQIRLLVASGKVSEAITQGAKWSAEANPRDADLDLAFLEAIVADKSAANSSQSLMEKLSEIEAKHGPYWGRRSSALVLKHAPAGMAAGNLELLTRTADQLYLQKNWEEAIAAYDKAAQKAKEEKKDAQYADLASRAALIEQERKGYSEAVRRFLEVAAAPEAKAVAAETYLSAAWNQMQLVLADPKDAKAFVLFEQIVKDQIAKFPDAPTTSTAKLWLAKAYKNRGEMDAAYKVAEAIAEAAKERDEGSLICLEYWNARTASFSNRKNGRLDPALKWAAAAEGDLSTKIRRRIRATALGWELLNRQDADHAQLEQKLNELIEKTPDTEPDTIASAKTLLVIALAAQPTKHAEAARLLAESGGTAKQQLTSLLGLVKVTKSAGHEVQPALGKFVLTAIEKLKPSLSQLSENEKLHVDLAYAEGLLASGNGAEAYNVLEKLSKKHPLSANVQETYAIALSEAAAGTPGSPFNPPAKPTSWNEALTQWRLVASRSEPRTERWYRAKYHVAKTQFQMGQKADAAKLIDLLDATPPGLKGAPMEAEFRELRRQCDATSSR